VRGFVVSVCVWEFLFVIVCVGLLWPCVSGLCRGVIFVVLGFSRTPFFLLNIKDTQLSCISEKNILWIRG